MSPLFDPHKVPFSLRESFLCVSWLPNDQSFWIRNLRGGDEHNDDGKLLRIEAADKAQLSPACLDLGGAEFIFEDGDTLRIRTDSRPLRLSMARGKYNYVHQSIGKCVARVARQDLGCDMSAMRGGLTVSSNWDGLSVGETTFEIASSSELRLHFYRTTPARPGKTRFEALRRRNARQFETFLKQTAPVRPKHDEAHRLAAYILWSGYVPAEGQLKRPAIYMSKNVMNNIWSWDHCFTALALGKLQPEKAFEQMAIVFDHQHVSGRLPDFINDRFAYWSFTKPPIHGWAFNKLREAAPKFYTKPKMRQVVAWLELQAESWRSAPHFNGLPAYAHGNDGGWDNSTMFLQGTPVTCPDLPTFLILQYDAIAALHAKLGDRAAAKRAKAKSDKLLTALLKALWTGERFVARLQADGSAVPGGQSLQGFIPLLLGQRLPECVRQKMLAALFAKDMFFTEHGFATEAAGSNFYRPDGYWRGPIWAPTTYLLVDALQHCAEHARANDVAMRFCAMAARRGMAENFNALTGEGQCDPAFAWTSAVFLMLAATLEKKPY